MGKIYDHIPDSLAEWAKKQEMFWVASAPLTGEGHVNVSPKGVRGSFHIVNKNQVWYEDLSGSGVETISHMREPGNARVTILFCAFEGAPRILRMFGKGKVHEFGTPEYDALIPPESRLAGSRAAIVIDVHRVGTSCGYGIPRYDFKSHRRVLVHWADKMEDLDVKFASDEASCPAEEVTVQGGEARVYPKRSMKHWWASMNLRSVDGLPGLAFANLASDVPKMGAAGLSAIESGGAIEPVGTKAAKAAPTVSPSAIFVPASKEEVVRLVLAVSIGVAVAAVYVQMSGLTTC